MSSLVWLIRKLANGFRMEYVHDVLFHLWWDLTKCPGKVLKTFAGFFLFLIGFPLDGGIAFNPTLQVVRQNQSPAASLPSS